MAFVAKVRRFREGARIGEVVRRWRLRNGSVERGTKFGSLAPAAVAAEEPKRVGGLTFLAHLLSLA